MLQEQIGITNPFYPAGSFAQANVAAEQAGVALLTPGGVGHRTALLPAMLAAVEVNLAAGDEIGAKITTNAAWNGTTSEIEVIPHMVYQGWEF